MFKIIVPKFVIFVYIAPYVVMYICRDHVYYYKMAKMHLSIDDDLDDRFRMAVAKKKGMKKGNLAEAVEEAMKDWIKAK